MLEFNDLTKGHAICSIKRKQVAFFLLKNREYMYKSTSKWNAQGIFPLCNSYLRNRRRNKKCPPSPSMNSFQSWLVKGITQEFEKTKQNKTLTPGPHPQGFWFNVSGLRFEHGHFQSCLSDSNLRSWLRVATLDAVRDSWRQMPLTISSRKCTVLHFCRRRMLWGRKDLNMKWRDAGFDMGLVA